jgi:hypothetical protein
MQFYGFEQLLLPLFALIGLPIKVIIIVRSKHKKHNLTDNYNLIFMYILILFFVSGQNLGDEIDFF